MPKYGSGDGRGVRRGVVRLLRAARRARHLADAGGRRSSASGMHDPFGPAPEGIPIKVTITIDPEAGMIELDLTDNIDCLPAGVNESRTCAMNNCMTGHLQLDRPRHPAQRGDLSSREGEAARELRRRHPAVSAFVLGGDDERRRAPGRDDPADDRRRLGRLRARRGRVRDRPRLRSRLRDGLAQGGRALREPEVPRLSGWPGRARVRRLGHVRQRRHQRADVPRQRRDRRAEVPDPGRRGPDPRRLGGSRAPARRARRRG